MKLKFANLIRSIHSMSSFFIRTNDGQSIRFMLYQEAAPLTCTAFLNILPFTIGIFYGEGKLVDSGNIFGKVFEQDKEILARLGNITWKQGAQVLMFEK
jgi:hypothetical protein